MSTIANSDRVVTKTPRDPRFGLVEELTVPGEKVREIYRLGFED